MLYEHVARASKSARFSYIEREMMGSRYELFVHSLFFQSEAAIFTGVEKSDLIIHDDHHAANLREATS